MQTMIEKLKLAADALEQEKEAEYNAGDGWLHKVLDDDTIYISKSVEYRIKPDKPRTGLLSVINEVGDWKEICVMAIESTPEVRAALEAAGIEI
jgi:hypothetical protein